ncbi:tRNA pseudouridine38-40 synthase [Sinobacterium caligoides]|uniref:tRNA pseudouridine synthase A n=1 Tax=Sinobacterium caligoides TaxID=933926 RepID=A0A3N2DPN4_9GAMM|nr:tRNA pseudouridine(38-40) synthase TruA [Sinobacterium caligoides]ROS01788.1 tRNA pseudouridine38-40 synthase [Sinobacterium caligoides]
MYYYRVTIAYKGSNYFGWQAQSTATQAEEKPTIEGRIRNALSKITNYQPCTISAASRTDAGVHAQGQLAKLSLSLELDAERLLLGLNAALPDDIRILTCQPATKSYQPNRSSISKEYHYYFTAAAVDNVATADIAQHLPMISGEPEEIQLLRDACQLFVGRHDFYNFCQRDKSLSSYVREIFYCDILPANLSPLANDVYYLKIVGDGFLKFMIRYLVGTLIALAKGKISLDDIVGHLSRHHESKLSGKAKAKGLHLIAIKE